MDRELTLDELLEAPIVRLLMRRDGIEAHEIRALFETIRARTAADHDHPSRQTVSVVSSRHTGIDLFRCGRRNFGHGAQSLKNRGWLNFLRERLQRPPRP